MEDNSRDEMRSDDTDYNMSDTEFDDDSLSPDHKDKVFIPQRFSSAKRKLNVNLDDSITNDLPEEEDIASEGEYGSEEDIPNDEDIHGDGDFGNEGDVLSEGGFEEDMHSEEHNGSEEDIHSEGENLVEEGMDKNGKTKEAIGKKEGNDMGNVSFEEPHVGDSMFECCYCKILFTDAQALGHHLEDAHMDMEDISNILQKLANDTSLYEIKPESKDQSMDDKSPQFGGKVKKKRVFKDLQIMCDYPGCGRIFIRRGALQTHQVVHEVSKECPHCGLEVKAMTALLRHIERKHSTTVTTSRVDCIYPNCNKTFKNAWALKIHQLLHSEDNNCFTCGKDFEHVLSLQQHMWDLHRPSPKIQKPKKGGGGGGKNDKNLTDESLEEYDDLCDEEIHCDYEYACTHEGCKLVFETPDKLNWHMKYTFHHESNHNLEPFHCPYKTCDMKFKTKAQVCNHMKQEHYGTKKLKTAAAAKLAKDARMAKMSLSITSNLRKCPVCCEMFANESKMKQHLRRHSTESQLLEGDVEGLGNETNDRKLVFELKMYKCPLCHTTYHSVNRLKYHFEHHHGGDIAIEHLVNLEKCSEDYLSVEPTTLYGDSFKKGKKKIPSSIQVEPSLESSKDSKTVACPIEISPDKTLDAEYNALIESNMRDQDGNGDDIDVLIKKSVDEAINDSINDLKDMEQSDMRADGDELSSKGNGQKNGKDINRMCRYPSCSMVFRNRFELMRHQRTHEKLLKCPHVGCDQGFFNSSNLRLHIQLVHTEFQDTKCKDCGVVGKRSYILYRHPRYCPKTVDLTCPECGVQFRKVSSYTNHVRSHDKKVTCNYPCEYDGCIKRFRTRQDRSRHHNVHSGARPHACPYANCTKTYKQRPHLLVHLKASHTIRKDEVTRTYTCEHCEAVFKRQCGRLKHIRKSCIMGPNRESILENRKRRPSVNNKS